MARRRIERNNTKISPSFHRPKEVKDFVDLNPDDLPSLDINELIAEYGVVSVNNSVFSTGLPTPTFVEIVNYIFHKDYSGNDVVDYIFEVPTDAQTIAFDIRIAQV